MKVIKAGRKQNGWAKKCKCTGKGNDGGGCGAILLVEEGDLIRTGTHVNYADDHEYMVSFKCQQCGVLTDISDYPGDMWKLKAGPGGRRP